MDTLYIGDIPLEFHYAIFNSDYIDLYDSEYLTPNSSYNYYRIYLYDNAFFYQRNVRNTSYNFTIQQLSSIDVSNDYWYRRDFDSICFIGLVLSILLFLLTNLFTTFIRKNGVLSGLL